MRYAIITVLLVGWMFLPVFGQGHQGKKDFVETAFGINMKMVYVEGGDFLMGGTSEQGRDVYDDEEVLRRVHLDFYYIGMFEVTQEQWEKVMGENLNNSKKGADYPVEVSWEEAHLFCKALSSQTGKAYCLPTEAQWEFAARGGNKNEALKYSGGASIDSVGWYMDNSNASSHPVGMKRPNALGLYDMSGNVWEWCQDWYDYYQLYEMTNPLGAPKGSYRVLRGGSWCDYARRCRVSVRTANVPSTRSSCSGFRIALLP